MDKNIEQNNNGSNIEQYNFDTLGASPYTALLINQDIPPHKHFFWEFTYSLNGSQMHYVNDTAIEMHALSKIILLKPSDIHKIVKSPTCHNNNPQQHRDIYVSINKMKKICNLLDKNLYQSLCNSPAIEIVAKHENLDALESTLNLLNAYEASFSSHLDLFDQLHTAVIFQVLSIHIKNQLSIKKSYPAWVEEFFTNIKSEEYLRKNIKEIVDELFYSHGYVCRKFKELVGKTMVQCLNESRIAYSTVLLLNSSKSIIDIAMLLNYNSQSAYINAFKKVYNVSPSNWRKQMSTQIE